MVDSKNESKVRDAKERWSSRKFWSAMTWQSVMTLLVLMDKIPANIFETLTFLLLGGYFLSNVAQKALLRK